MSSIHTVDAQKFTSQPVLQTRNARFKPNKLSFGNNTKEYTHTTRIYGCGHWTFLVQSGVPKMSYNLCHRIQTFQQLWHKVG